MINAFDRMPPLFIILFPSMILALAGAIPAATFFGFWGWFACQVPMLCSPIFILFGNRAFLIKFICLFNKKWTAIELIDFQNDRYFTIAKVRQDGRLAAPVYFFADVGLAYLNADGTIDKQAGSCYLDYWLPLYKSQRVEHLLRYEIPNLAKE